MKSNKREDNNSKQINRSSEIKDEIVSIGKNSAIYMVGRFLSQGVGFIMIPVYTKFISPTNYGVMEMIGILITMVTLILSIGVSEGMARFYFAEKERLDRQKVVSTIVIGFGAIGIPVLALFILASKPLTILFLDDAAFEIHLIIALISVWFGMLCEVGFTYLRITYRAKLFIVVTTVQLVVALSLNIWFIVYLKYDILGIFYSTLISFGLIGSLLAITILKENGLKLSFPLLKKILGFGLPIVPSKIGLFLGFVSNRFFLRWMGSPDPIVALSQIGIYTLGHKFGVIVNRFFNAPFNSFWAPRRIELLLNEDRDDKKIVARICTYSTLCSCLIGLVLSAGIKSVIEIMADPKYIDAYKVVPFVTLAYVALGLEAHFMTGIVISKKTLWSSYITVCSLIIIIAWNYVFVPRYGIIGAATSNLAGFLIRVLLIYYISQRLYYIPFEKGKILMLFLVAALMFICSQFIIFQSPIQTFIIRTSFVASYPLILLLIGFFNKEEVRIAIQSFQKIRKAII